MSLEIFPELILANRINLRKHTLDQYQMMFDCVDQDRQRLRKFLPWVDGMKSAEDERTYIQSTLEKWEKKEHFDYGIFSSPGSGRAPRYMGNIGVHSIFWNHKKCEIGYWILGEFEGNGYMSEAVSALEAVCFQRGFNRVEIRCSSRNARSVKVPVRLGYCQEGVLRQERIENGECVDTFIFAKLLSDIPTSPNLK